jgi:hypothetical protein
MNFHEPLEIKCNFQRPSSSDSPLQFGCTSKYERQSSHSLGMGGYKSYSEGMTLQGQPLGIDTK